MKVLVWNVNGIRAISKKKIFDSQTFEEYINDQAFDVLCFTETKICEEGMKKLDILNNYLYQYHSHSCTKKGYSGVSIFSKVMPINTYQFQLNGEGRVITLDFEQFILVNVYQPNSGAKLARLEFRTIEWAKAFSSYIDKMMKINKNIIVVGDMNVARTEMDVFNPDKHTHYAGFTIEERNTFEKLLDKTELIDVWRERYPDKIEYTYFDYRSRARKRNAGWRLDYVLTNKTTYKKIKDINILSDVYGSDHLPMSFTIDY